MDNYNPFLIEKKCRKFSSAIVAIVGHCFRRFPCAILPPPPCPGILANGQPGPKARQRADPSTRHFLRPEGAFGDSFFSRPWRLWTGS